MAQALVRYLCNQFIEIEGEKVPLFAGVFAIFGHGNVTCLGEALESVKERLPTWRGQNEQSMALAAIGYAKAKLRRQKRKAEKRSERIAAAKSSILNHPALQRKLDQAESTQRLPMPPHPAMQKKATSAI